jgi:hypothetical protein
VTQREYLISLGLAKATRGKFSREGHAALATAREGGMVFDDDHKATPVKREPAVAPVDHSRLEDGRPSVEPGGNWTPDPPQLRIRQIRAMWCEDDRGLQIQFQTCRKCAFHVSFCKCADVGMPYGAVRLLDRTDPMLVG